MDAGNGSKIYADAVGKPVSRPQTAGDIASPIDLLSPDRYEFYTFDDSGDLVKRLMTLEEIHDIIATGDDDPLTLDSLASNGFIPEKRVNDVVNNVQNVLKEEIKMHKNPEKPQFDTPDVSDSWSMILPAVFGNSGADIKPELPITHVTPDTIMVEPTVKVVATTEQISTTEKVSTLFTKKTTPTTTTSTTEKTPMINVEIITNSNSTTERTVNVVTDNSPVVEIKPQHDLEATKENLKPYLVSKSTKRPYPVRVTTFRPVKKPIQIRSTTPSTTTKATSSSSSTTTQGTSTTPSTTIISSITSTTTSTTPKSTLQIISIATPSTTTQAPLTEVDDSQQSSTVFFQKLDPVKVSTTADPDSIQQSSSLVFEKIVPPTENTAEIFTTSEVPTTVAVTSTTELTTTNLPETTTVIPTTTEIFKSAPDAVAEKIIDTTVQPDLTTFGSLSTFMVLSDDEVPQELLKNTEDLTPQSTEYINNKYNSSFDSTTERQSTDRSTIDQLLLTSTNIYEINSELSEVKGTTSFEEPTTSAEDNSSERIYVRLTNPTEQPTSTTTDKTFIDTIEQLISQAVGTIPPPVDQEKEAALVQEMMMNSTNKTMPEIMSETATIASKLVGVTEEAAVPISTIHNIDMLSDSFGSLLSQVYSDVTTIENDVNGTTTESATTSNVISTTLVPPTTTQEIITETTTLEEDFVPHIINITIIRNANRTQSKPAKSDISLEKDLQELYKEMKKNSSVASNGTSEEVLKTDGVTTEMFSETTTGITDSTELSTTTVPLTTPLDPQPSIVITINETKSESDDNNWTPVSTITPHKDTTLAPLTESPIQQIASIVDPPVPVDLVPKPLQGFGLEDSTVKLDNDIYQFVQLCNELAFGFWKSVTSGISTARSVVVSPFAATSLLAMVFLGARGATSGEMNEILKLDDMVTFNPHLIFKNVSESIEANPNSGVAVSAIVRELYSDRSKGKLLGFYKERVRQFYDGHVEEASFREIGDVIRRRTNLLVKKSTDGKIMEFLKDGSIVPKAPLAGVSISIFQTDCSQGSIEGRDGELHFVVLPTMRHRRLIPIPATTYRTGFLAGYEPSLDATAAALGTKDQIISTIFIIPGQQGIAAPGDGLARLEKRLVESSFKKGAWSRLLRALIPRPGLELQIPRFQHRSLINATQSLKRMGLHDLFDARKADLKGLSGVVHELYLSDVIQVNDFATCGERRIEEHHKEVYPATADRKSRLLLQEWEEPRDYQRAFHDPLHDPSYLELPLALRPRQARLPDTPRLRFDRPFLYFVRHNPSGLILHMGRFNPRLLP